MIACARRSATVSGESSPLRVDREIAGVDLEDRLARLAGERDDVGQQQVGIGLHRRWRAVQRVIS